MFADNCTRSSHLRITLMLRRSADAAEFDDASFGISLTISIGSCTMPHIQPPSHNFSVVLFIKRLMKSDYSISHVLSKNTGLSPSSQPRLTYKMFGQWAEWVTSNPCFLSSSPLLSQVTSDLVNRNSHTNQFGSIWDI